MNRELINFLIGADTDAIIKELNKMDLTEVGEMQAEFRYKAYLLKDAGVEHYKLLAYMAAKFPGETIFDIGTHFGNSSLALSMPGTAHIISYDVIDCRKLKKLPRNVIYRVGDFRENPELLGSPFIFIDVDPHDGIQEAAFHEFFMENKYNGIVMWDDILANDAMKSWWDSLDVEKYNITGIGHWSGTGMTIYAS